MEIFLPDSPDQIAAKLRRRLTGSGRSGILNEDRLKSESASLRNLIVHSGSGKYSPNSPLILTGHQPIFYPPGILIKDYLADAVASSVNGTACNIVVDTDEARIIFQYPQIREFSSDGKTTAVKESITLNRPGEALRFQALSAADRDRFHRALKNYELGISSVFSPARTGEIRRWIANLSDIVLESKWTGGPGVALRETWEKENDLNLKTIYASEIVQSSAFRYFLEFIASRGRDFRASYNNALSEYRHVHRIKNTAQPLPDLNEEKRELPFWTISSGRREPLTEVTAEKNAVVFPRAVTLTLFCRIFLCDLFIHGRGGGRYDQITDRILETFFGCDASPFTVASATLSLDSRADYPMLSRTSQEIWQDIRAVHFDPTRFLDPDHSLRREKNDLLNLFNSETGRRRPLHLRIIELNQKASALLHDFQRTLQIELERETIASRNRSVFLDRTFPFIFYDLSFFSEALRPYRTPFRLADAAVNK